MVGLETSKSLLNLTSRVIAALPLYQEIEKHLCRKATSNITISLRTENAHPFEAFPRKSSSTQKVEPRPLNLDPVPCCAVSRKLSLP